MQARYIRALSGSCTSTSTSTTTQYASPHTQVGRTTSVCSVGERMAQSQKYTAHTAQRRHRQRYTVQVVARGAAGINQEEQTESLPWETENLVALLEKMMDNGVKAEEMPEADWIQAAAVASAPRTSISQLTRLLHAAAVLGLHPAATTSSVAWMTQGSSIGGSDNEPWVTYMLRASQGSLASASPTDILGLLSVVLQLQQQLLLAQEEEGEGGVADPVLLVPEGEWFAAAVTEIVKGADGLSAHAATGAVIIITELLSVVASPIDPGLWLDILLLRIAESDVRDVPSSDLVACAYLVACSHRHIPPQPFVQALFSDDNGACYRADWEPEEAAALAVVSASFRCVPDLLWVKQVYMQTYPGLREMPAFLVAEFAWAMGYWQAAKERTPRGQKYDYRPPASWWNEWFQATAPLLRSSPPFVCVRLIWAAAMLELRPPEQWLQQLVSTTYLHFQAGQHDPLELLYITKSSDLWWSQLLDSSNTATAANSSPPSTTATNSSLSSMTATDPPPSGANAPRSTPPSSSESPVVVMCGCPDVYEPPDRLSVLVQDAYDSLSQVSMPPQFWALNVRLVPPYALEDQQANNGAGVDNNEDRPVDADSTREAEWQMSTAARRVYGPVPPPPR